MNIIRIIILILSIFSFQSWSRAQITLTNRLIDSIGMINYNTGMELSKISEYNNIIKSLNIFDTICINIIDGEVVYKYQNQRIKDFRMRINNASPIQMDYSTNRHSSYFYVKITKNNNERTEILVTRSDTCNKKIIVKNFKDSVLSGEYIEKCFNGQVYNLGKYMQIDSVYRDTIIYYDSETYEEIVKIEERKKIAEKCGDWILQTEKGIINKKFKPCK